MASHGWWSRRFEKAGWGQRVSLKRPDSSCTLWSHYAALMYRQKCTRPQCWRGAQQWRPSWKPSCKGCTWIDRSYYSYAFGSSPVRWCCHSVGCCYTSLEMAVDSGAWTNCPISVHLNWYFSIIAGEPNDHQLMFNSFSPPCDMGWGGITETSQSSFG